MGTISDNKYYPSVGEFGFCCEAEKMSILFSNMRKKNWDNFDVFKRDFKVRYADDANGIKKQKMKLLHQKYYEYAIDGTMDKIKEERRDRLNSELSEDITNQLAAYDLRVTRADGRGTSHQVKKCRRKKQYNHDRLSGYCIMKTNGKVIAGKKFELYEDDVVDFLNKLDNNELTLTPPEQNWKNINKKTDNKPKTPKVIVGETYYVTSRYDCTSCFKVRADEVLNETSVLVTPMTKSKKGENKEPKQFSLPISALHKKAKSAVHGYKQHH